MKIQVSTDHNIDDKHAGLSDHINAVLEDVVGRFSDRITRIEVHISDENAQKSGGADKKCLMEARFEGKPPTVVSHHAETVHQAIGGAADKLLNALDHLMGKIRAH